MAWEISSDRPVYVQLIEELQLRIISGYYKSGEKMPAVRELASEAAVNPNTMQKALSELEREGLLYANRTSGRFVTEDKQLIDSTRLGISVRITEDYLKQMKKLGLSGDEILEIVSSNQQNDLEG